MSVLLAPGERMDKLRKELEPSGFPYISVVYTHFCTYVDIVEYPNGHGNAYSGDEWHGCASWRGSGARGKTRGWSACPLVEATHSSLLADYGRLKYAHVQHGGSVK